MTRACFIPHKFFTSIGPSQGFSALSGEILIILHNFTLPYFYGRLISKISTTLECGRYKNSCHITSYRVFLWNTYVEYSFGSLLWKTFSVYSFRILVLNISCLYFCILHSFQEFMSYYLIQGIPLEYLC